MHRKLLILFIFALFLNSCNYAEKEKQLIERESLLTEKEKLFEIKEAEYQSLLQLRDSLRNSKSDTIVHQGWPEFLKGQWQSKMVCKESNCSTYAVGDQRTDYWEFSNDDDKMLIKVSNKNQPIREYKGFYENNIVKASYTSDSTAIKQIKMEIILDDFSSDKIKGMRIVNADNSCVAKYSLELSKIKEKL